MLDVVEHSEMANLTKNTGSCIIEGLRKGHVRVRFWESRLPTEN